MDIVENINALVNKATHSLTETQQLFSNLVNEAKINKTDTASPEEEARCFQLILDYRLSNQDALVSLLNLDKHLLYILGIQPHHSAKVNLERLTFALGSDDLKQILHVLNRLLDNLLRIAHRYENQQKKSPENHKKSGRALKLIKGMQAVALKQTIFLNSIHTLEKDMTQMLRLEAMSPIYDHIAALRGPISQFYQAILNGLEKSKILYEQVNQNQAALLGFDLLLEKTDVVLQQMPSLYQPQPNYSLGHFSPKTSEELEERAAAKRIRPFF